MITRLVKISIAEELLDVQEFLCVECSHKFHYRPDPLLTLVEGEDPKFCPVCGRQVMR
jgi:rubrerythrin